MSGEIDTDAYDRDLTMQNVQQNLPTTPNIYDAGGSSTAYDDACVVQLPQFEGPLDLLLHLITKHELDILDIPIHFITEKYLEYLTIMHVLSLDIASEYLVMAATLAHIKSKTLLPVVCDDDQDPVEQFDNDPREELVRRLLEYQKYKAAASELINSHILGEDIFGPTPIQSSIDKRAPLAPASVFCLIDAFQQIANRCNVRIDHEIDFDRISITERIAQLMQLLQEHTTCALQQLMDKHATRGDLIITFLALLEMTRLRMTRLNQPYPLAPLHVCLAETDNLSFTQGDNSATHQFVTTNS